MLNKDNYLNALYRRNNNGIPCYWLAENNENYIKLSYGIVNKTNISDILYTHRNINDEIDSKIKNKRKTGYKYLNEVKDNNELPVEEELYEYLDKYLPYNRTTEDNRLLPMLAKTYDNTNNKLFKEENCYYGQAKINGLRCIITVKVNDDIFKPFSLQFMSREGVVWNSLNNLEDKLLNILEDKLKYLYENDISLDGELYLPGYTVNDINHFVKDNNSFGNKLLQYWCYDLLTENMNYIKRYESKLELFRNNIIDCYNYDKNNNNCFKILEDREIRDEDEAIEARNAYIDNGFEGLIMRNIYKEYQFGKRNSSMIKFKKSTDGIFKIIDIKPEGIKRPDIPLFTLKNDINDAEFNCHIGGSLDYQKEIFKNKDKYIGLNMYVEYGERSGINAVPFHIKTTYIKK